MTLAERQERLAYQYIHGWVTALLEDNSKSLNLAKLLIDIQLKYCISRRRVLDKIKEYCLMYPNLYIDGDSLRYKEGEPLPPEEEPGIRESLLDGKERRRGNDEQKTTMADADETAGVAVRKPEEGG